MARVEIERIQIRLKELGLYAGRADGVMSPGGPTEKALKAFQKINGLDPDGIAGPKTKAKLWPEAMPIRDYVPPFPAPAAAREWPRQVDVPDVFGPAGGPRATAGTVILPIPFRLAWALDTEIKKYSCNDAVAVPMAAIWNAAVAHYGESEFRRLRLDLFGGCYANRPMRGGSRPSMHAFGIAYDVDPEHNQLKWTRDRASLDGAEYDPFWRIVEAQGAVSLGRVANFDWMHFQFARL